VVIPAVKSTAKPGSTRLILKVRISIRRYVAYEVVMVGEAEVACSV